MGHIADSNDKDGPAPAGNEVEALHASTSPASSQIAAPPLTQVLTTTNEEDFIKANLPPYPKFEEEGVGYFQWVIDDWTQLPDRLTSAEFTVAGHSWDILLFPRGNQVEDMVSLYVEYKPKEGNSDDWHACAQFSLAMSNVDDPAIFIHNSAHHRFTSDESDWGFTRFIDLRRMMAPPDADTHALMEGGRVRISAYVRVIKDVTGVLWHNFHNYDSRKQTGYVGLRNQGATCYMNSLLQSLYFTNEFRNAVYQIPTENDDPKKSVALALQRVFYNLQVSPDPVDTTELTKSFGWDSLESFMQHDVQEFNRVLQDNLETKMKGTAADGAIERLFVGRMKSYIRCVNVDYESSRVENYYDISLNVKGCETLRDSFVNYCEVEMLDGENKYQAEGHGLQDARKGVIFESFPPVLQLQLKRFEYDFMRDTMVKINDRHEFPPTIDLGDFLSDDADRSMPWRYSLHGVLVHSGDLHGGHYFGLLRPTGEDKWFRFDDDRVIPITREDVFEEYYGGDYGNTGAPGARARPQTKRFTNAYMLVYIRECLRDRVLCSGDAPVPEHLLRRIQEAKAEEERRKREKEELMFTLPVKVICDEQFEKHQGFDLCYFDDRQPSSNAIFSERVRKSTTLRQFTKYFGEKIGKKPEDFRFWSMVGRVNKTTRCDFPLVSNSADLTLAQIKESRSLKWPDLRLYCEMRGDTPVEVFASNAPPAGTSLIHTKFYDPIEGVMRGVGHLYVRADQRVGEIIPQLREFANIPDTSGLRLFEEIKPGLIDEMDPNITFHSAEIQTGDIICFQVAMDQETAAEKLPSGALATVPKYFEDVQYRVRARFIPKPVRSEFDEFGSNEASGSDESLEDQTVAIVASTKTPYDVVSQRVAAKLGIRDQFKLRFYTVSPTGQPRNPVRRSGTTTLNDMLPGSLYVQPTNVDGFPEFVVMYERIEVSIDQIDSMRMVRVTYVGKTMKEEHQLEVLAPKTSDMQKLMESTYAKVEQALRSMQPAGSPALEPISLKFYEVSNHRFDRLLNGDEPLLQLGNPRISEIVAERITDDSVPPVSAKPSDGSGSGSGSGDESKMDMDNPEAERAHTVEVFHFNRDLHRAHSLPFLFNVYPGEKWADTWERLERKLGLGEKELKNLGAVYGQQGTTDLKACRVLQGTLNTEGGVVTTPSTGHHTPSATPPPAEADLESMSESTLNNVTMAAAALGNNGSQSPEISNTGSNGSVAKNSELCLWDVIEQTLKEGNAATTNGQHVLDGFIGLNHIDRSSRNRLAHHERAIRILN